MGCRVHFDRVNKYSIAYLGAHNFRNGRHHRLDLFQFFFPDCFCFSSLSFRFFGGDCFRGLLQHDSFNRMVSIGGFFWLELFGLHFTFFRHKTFG